MKPNRSLTSLGCLSLNALAAAAAVVLIVAAITLIQGGILFSPGALSAQAAGAPLSGVKSHAEITRCELCHGTPLSGGSMDDACLACHTDLSQDPGNFHNRMIAQKRSSGCITCHTDHRGAAAALTKENIAAFPHDLVGFSLRAHPTMADGTPFQCSGCHPGTYRGFDPGVCDRCHALVQPDFSAAHGAAFGQNCTACHDGLDSYGHAFDHQQVGFALAGKHAGLTCNLCHAGARTLVDLKGKPQACAACHADPAFHQGLFGSACATCHTATAWTPAKFNQAHAFPIGHGRSGNSCRTCHPAGLLQYSCYSCHSQNSLADEHRNRGDITNCIKCHPNGQEDD